MNGIHAVRAVVSGFPHLLFGGRSAERAGVERLASRRLAIGAMPRLELSSPAFADGDWIPERFAAVGANTSPPLVWSGVPASARSLALLVEDPFAPTIWPFLHWAVADLPPTLTGLVEGDRTGVQGRSSRLKPGWFGCAPPKGDLPHTYHFQLFALDRPLGANGHPGRAALLARMRGHVVGYGELVGKFERDQAGQPVSHQTIH